MIGQKENKVDYFNKIAPFRDSWNKRSKYYHQQIENLCKFIIPAGKKVLEIGCGTGDLLKAVSPQYGLGIDISSEMIKIARKKYRSLKFNAGDAEKLNIQEIFDYIILSDLIGHLDDIQLAFNELHKVADERTRIVITYYNFFWEFIINLAEKIKLKMPQPAQNWLSSKDIENLLDLADLEVVKKGTLILLPVNIPLFSDFCNRILTRLPILKHLALVSYFIVRKKPSIYTSKEYSVSIIIPVRNERGNIEQAIIRTPILGKWQEFIFVEGNSKDGTAEEIKRVIKLYKGKRKIMLIDQGQGIGKADAVRKGFNKAKGDILMILDGDLTVRPEELPKFYRAIRSGKGEMIQGSRLVYQMEDQAMRFLNIAGNKIFGLAFSWLLDQQIKDTLCGTKVLFRNDYLEISRNRSYFGDFDPFGDYDLIFGASKLNLKIIEIPIRYQSRTYGSTNISRFRHGWLLLKMTLFAAKKIKFI